jgi:trimeric autotransporter adhesin
MTRRFWIQAAAIVSLGLSGTLALAQTVTPSQAVLSFPASPVGVSGSGIQKLTATFNITNGTAFIPATAVLHYGTSYSAGTVNCTGTGIPTETCTVQISFVPAFPGGRRDAVFLMNGTTRLATVLLYGVGQSPLGLIQPGVITQPIKATTTNIFTSVVDENGTTYVLESSAPAVVSVTKAGVVTTVPITGLNNPRTISIDGAGVLYIASAAHAIPIITYDTVQKSQGTIALPVAGDEFPVVAAGDSGNVYYIDLDAQVLYTTTIGGITTHQALSPAISGANSMTVDSSENLFIGGTTINEILAGGGAQSQVNANNSQNTLAVDAAGTLYSSTYSGAAGVTELPAAPASPALPYSTPLAALDTAVLGSPGVLGGSIGPDGTFYLGNGSSLDKVDRTQGLVAFGNNTIGNQTVSIYNGGNQSLTVSSIAITGSSAFTLGTATANNCTGGITIAPGALCNVLVSYSTTHAGVFAGTLTFTDNSLNSATSTHTVAITAEFQGIYVTASPTLLDFGNVAIGATSATQQVTFTNNGDFYSANLAVPQNTGAFNVTAGTCVAPLVPLAVGASCTMNVTFVPTLLTQVYTGGTTGLSALASFQFGTMPVTFFVNATAIMPSTAVGSFAPASLAFGTQNINTTSPSQALLLTNTGTSQLNLNSISITGTNLSNFSETNTCGGGLAPNGSCTINVTFSPNVVGPFSATVSVATNATTSPTTATLTGTGVSVQVPQLQFNPAQLNTIGGSTTPSPQGNDTGDGGTALAARFGGPFGIAQDAAGNMYVADQEDNYVRKIDTTGKITAFAGLPSNGPGSFGGDGGQAAAANLSQPIGVAVDAAGNVYISDYGNSRIRMVTPAGIISTFAGIGNGFFNGGPRMSVAIPGPEGLVFDAAGNLYIACVNQQIVVKIDTTGNASKFAGVLTNPGPGIFGFNGDNQLAINAELNFPQDVAADQAGNIYIADTGNFRVRKVAASTGIITTVAGNGTQGNTGDGLAAVNIETTAVGITTNLTGDLFISTGPTIRRVDATTGIISTYAGGGVTPYVTGGAATTSLLAGIGLPRVDHNGSLMLPVASPLSFYGVLLVGRPGFVQFGNVGSISPTQTVIFENTGDAPLTLSQTTYSAPNPNFMVTGGTCQTNGSTPGISSLAPGATCTLNLVFQPGSSGPANSSITVGSNSAGGSQTIFLQANGAGSVGEVLVSPNPLVFGSVPVGNTVTLPIAVNNPGSGGVVFNSMTITGPNAGSFAISPATTCKIAIAAGNPCQIYISFTPAVPGVFTATFSLADSPAFGPPSPQTVTLTGNAVNFVSNVGTALPAQQVPVAVSINGALTSIQVLTQGATNLDFTQTTGGTCTVGTFYTIGQTCTVNVIFDPLSPGQRLGYVSLSAAGGVTLGASYISGTGKGPQINFIPDTQSTLGSGFPNPVAVATDAAGNIYVADFTNNAVNEILAVNGVIPASPTIKTLGSGFDNPSGIAVDGAGDVFVADFGNGSVKEIVAVNGVIPASPTINVWSSKLLNIATAAGVAVDGNGNLFFTDSLASGVKELLAVNGSIPASPIENTLGTEWDGPTAVAVDASGNVFVADSGSNTVKEMLAVNGSIPTVATLVTNNLGSGFLTPQSVSVDAIGDVFVADTGNNKVKEILAVNGSIPATGATIRTLGTVNDFSTPRGVALDARGNVYVADSANARVVKLDYADAPSLSFANTAVGATSSDSPQTVTVENVGNAALTFPVPSSGNSPTISTNFGLGSAGTCTQLTSSSSAAATLAQGGSCTLLFNFTPTAVGLLTGSSVLTDNTLNVSGSTQSISLSGTGTSASGPQAALNPNPLNFPTTNVGVSSATMTMSLGNSGNAALAITSISITGAGAGSFSQTNNCGSSLALDSSCIITITFKPTAAGLQTASISVVDNATGSPHSATIMGMGAAAAVPQLAFSPNPLIFTSAAVGTPVTLPLVLSNPGSAVLNVNTYTLTGTNASNFTFTNGCSASLAAGANCTLMVTFTPTSTATVNAAISVSDNATGSPQTANLTGSVTAPAVATVAPLSPVAFANTAVGSTATALPITVSNTGGATLTGISFSLTGTNPGDFAITSASTCGTTLAAGASCVIDVSFTPASAAAFTATLSVSDSASGSPQTAAITGTGIIAATSFTVASTNPFSSVQPGGLAQYNLTIAPVGGTYSNLVTLSASGLPAGAVASFLPAAVTPGSAGAPSVLSIQTSTMLARERGPDPQHPGPVPLLAVLSGVSLLGLTLPRRLRKASRGWRLLAIAALSILPVLAMTGCNGGYFGPKPQTFTVTVTGTSGTLQETTTVSLTVQ